MKNAFSVLWVMGATLALPSFAVHAQTAPDSSVRGTFVTARVDPELQKRRAWLSRREALEAPRARGAEVWRQLEAQRLALAPLETGPAIGFAESVKVLPAPSQWLVLLRSARADWKNAPSAQSAAHYLFAARLNGDDAAQIEALRTLAQIWGPKMRRDLANLKPARDDDDSTENYRLRQKQRVAFEEYRAVARLLRASPSREQQVLGLRWEIETAPRVGSWERVEVPDFQAKWGEAVTRQLLLSMLRSAARFNWENAGKTLDLAREVYLQNPAASSVAPWDLLENGAATPQAQRQTERIAREIFRRFPRVTDRNGQVRERYRYSSARNVLLSAALNRGDFAQASRLMEEWNRAKFFDDFYYPGFSPDASSAHQIALLGWLETTLSRYPQLDWWNDLRVQSVRAGQTPRTLRFVENVIASPRYARFSPEQKVRLANVRRDCLLDVGEVLRGGAILVAQIEKDARTKNSNFEARSRLRQLLLLHRVVPQKTWMHAAKRGARILFAAPIDRGDSSAQAEALTDIALLFAQQNERFFARELLLRALQIAQKPAPKEERHSFHGEATTTPYLYGLASIYRDLNRPQQVRDLLEKQEGWGADQLGAALGYRGQHEWGYEDDAELKMRTRLGVLAAWALAKSGARAQAAGILRAHLERVGGDDRAYALLCDLEGQRALPFLRELQARDAFEERPLIWQAHLARRAKNPQLAQKLAQSAIQIDPSDGEQGRGDRLRAYAELAAALRAQGQNAKAGELETAVHAIRLSETADKWRAAGVSARHRALHAVAASFR